MTNKLKLAKLILIEIQSLKECSNFQGMANLAEEITKDAEQLAKIIEEEEAA